ncbi:hypothetical protein Q8A73_013401 [Channa argus]|nr:hypothetical protein Q8A73_013401 [Channa argus]
MLDENLRNDEVRITWDTYRAYVGRLQEAETRENYFKNRYLYTQEQLRKTEVRVMIYYLQLQGEARQIKSLTAENKSLKEELLQLQEELQTQQRPEGPWTWSPIELVKLGLCVGVATMGAVLLAKTLKSI